MNFLKLLLIPIVMILSGCLVSHVVSSNANSISIKYDPALDDPQSLQPRADAECKKFGKKAVFRDVTQTNFLSHGYAQYDCKIYN